MSRRSKWTFLCRRHTRWLRVMWKDAQHPCWLKWLKICLQFGRPRFDPWVRKFPWRREWQPTTAFFPGESHGQRSLMGYCLWSHTELDTTEQLTLWLHCLLEKCKSKPKWCINSHRSEWPSLKSLQINSGGGMEKRHLSTLLSKRASYIDSVVSDYVTVARQAPLSTGFSRQEY